MSSGSYNTKQKQLLLAFLESNKDKQLTCDEISEYLKKENTPISKTTVYRYLIKMTENGSVRKIHDQTDKSARFQYIDKSLNCAGHMHLKCLSCGSFVHLSCEFMNGVSEHISEHHRFTVDNSKTVLYGICDKCSSH